MSITLHCCLYISPLSPLPASSSSLGRLLRSCERLFFFKQRCDLDALLSVACFTCYRTETLSFSLLLSAGDRLRLLLRCTKRILPQRELKVKKNLLLAAISTPEEFYPSRGVCQTLPHTSRTQTLNSSGLPFPLSRCLPSSLRLRFVSSNCQFASSTSAAPLSLGVLGHNNSLLAAGEKVPKKMCPQCTCRLGQLGPVREGRENSKEHLKPTMTGAL